MEREKAIEQIVDLIIKYNITPCEIGMRYREKVPSGDVLPLALCVISILLFLLLMAVCMSI